MEAEFEGLFPKLKEDLAIIHNAYLKDVALGNEPFCVQDHLESKGKKKYLENTIRALGFRDPDDPDEELQNWLHTHLRLGYKNGWNASFDIGWSVRDVNSNFVLRALSKSTYGDKIVTFAGTLNTMVFTDKNFAAIEKSINEKQDVEIITIIDKLIMVRDGRNPILDFSEKYPDKIKIYRMDQRPFIHCNFIVGKNENGINYMTWRAPHYEHETVRSSLEMKFNDPDFIILDEYGLTMEGIPRLDRVTTDAYKSSKFKLREESDFTFSNWLKKFFLGQPQPQYH